MARRIPLSSRLLPGTRRRLRQLRLDLAGLGLRSQTPDAFHNARLAHLFGDAGRGREILAGEFARYGQTHPADPATTWTQALPSERFARYLHGFGWLHDLHAEGSDASADLARALSLSWLEDYGRYHSFAWKPALIAERLLAWATVWEPLFSTAGADAPDDNDVLRAAASRQAKYLSRTLDCAPPGPARLQALVALAMAGLRMRSGDALLSKAMRRLPDEISHQILPDGGHVSRSPEAALRAYADLKTLDDLLDARGRPAVPALSRALDRIVPMLATLSHTDGVLASFHGGGEGARAALSHIQARAEAKPFAFAPNSGYQRAQRGGTVLLMDVAEAPAFPHDSEAHISPLAFEMSTPAGRLIVNCGFAQQQPLEWRHPVRQLAAHSALDLEPAECAKWAESSATFDGQADSDLPLSHIAKAPSPVRGSRREAEPGILLEGSHGGFAASAGLVHSRRLFLAESGGEIRVEDRLEAAEGSVKEMVESQTVCLRLHLHPDVKAKLADAKTHIDLSLGEERWVFLASAPGFEFGLEASAYLGSGDKPVQTSQIVLRGTSSLPETVIRWGLRQR